jgi:hypothetical protein
MTYQPLIALKRGKKSSDPLGKAGQEEGHVKRRSLTTVVAVVGVQRSLRGDGAASLSLELEVQVCTNNTFITYSRNTCYFRIVIGPLLHPCLNWHQGWARIAPPCLDHQTYKNGPLSAGWESPSSRGYFTRNRGHDLRRQPQLRKRGSCSLPAIFMDPHDHPLFLLTVSYGGFLNPALVTGHPRRSRTCLQTLTLNLGWVQLESCESLYISRSSFCAGLRLVAL